MKGNALAVGGSETHRSGQALITVQHVRPGHFMTIVARRSTGARVNELTSGPWPTEPEARTAARNAYSAFASGRTVGQVLSDVIHGTTPEVVKVAERIVSNALAQLAEQGQHRQVRPTMAGAHLAAVSDPQSLILTAAAGNGGVIRRSRQATVAQLRALARKGLVVLNYESGRGARRVVESATLTERGARQAVAA